MEPRLRPGVTQLSVHEDTPSRGRASCSCGGVERTGGVADGSTGWVCWADMAGGEGGAWPVTRTSPLGPARHHSGQIRDMKLSDTQLPCSSVQTVDCWSSGILLASF